MWSLKVPDAKRRRDIAAARFWCGCVGSTTGHNQQQGIAGHGQKLNIDAEHMLGITNHMWLSQLA